LRYICVGLADQRGCLLLALIARDEQEHRARPIDELSDSTGCSGSQGGCPKE
jgi:hypothetical protein